jgi:hypothetical protein
VTSIASEGGSLHGVGRGVSLRKGKNARVKCTTTYLVLDCVAIANPSGALGVAANFSQASIPTGPVPSLVGKQENVEGEG